MSRLGNSKGQEQLHTIVIRRDGPLEILNEVPEVQASAAERAWLLMRTINGHTAAGKQVLNSGAPFRILKQCTILRR